MSPTFCIKWIVFSIRSSSLKLSRLSGVNTHCKYHCVLRWGLDPVSVHHRPCHGSRQVVPPTDNTASPMHSIQRIRPSEQSCSCSSPGWSPPCSGPYLEGDTGQRNHSDDNKYRQNEQITSVGSWKTYFPTYKMFWNKVSFQDSSIRIKS